MNTNTNTRGSRATSTARSVFQSIVSSLLGVILLATAVLTISPSAKAEEMNAAAAFAVVPAPVNGSQAIFQITGYFAAQDESRLLLAYTDTIGFRNMAYNNRCIALILFQSGYLMTALYFEGRAQGFDAAADLLEGKLP
jgi:uncharacterized membrane protein